MRGLVGEEDTATPVALQVRWAGVQWQRRGRALMGMFRRAYQLGKLRDGVAIAEAAASLRPRFGVSHFDEQAPESDHGPAARMSRWCSASRRWWRLRAA